MSNIISGGEEFDNYSEGSNSFGELLIKKLTSGGDRTAFINGKTGDSTTFLELKQKSLFMAKCLVNLGIQKYDKVAIITDNRFEFLHLSLGAIYIGATAVPISLAYKEYEMHHSFEIINPKVVLTTNYASTLVSKIAKKFNCHVVLLEDEESFQNFTKNVDENIKETDILAKDFNIFEDVTVILHSSGTTGLPKGVELTHANMMTSLRGLMEMNDVLREESNFGAKDVMTYLGVAPWSHSMGFFSCMWFIFSSEKFVFLDRFEPQAYLKSIERFEVNCIISVPALMIFLCKTNLFDDYDLSSLREIICGAASISKDLEAAVKLRFNNKLKTRQIYGMTETSTLVTFQKGVFKSGSIGSVLRGCLVKIVGPNGEALGPNQNGEICTKGLRVMKGYIGNEKATRETIDEEGWLHTGDMGYYDEDQQFFMIERIKELIKYNAFQVPPAEIESLLLTHPKVKEVGVVGFPDRETGEKAMAFIVKQPNVLITETEIIEFVAKNLSKPKQLHGGVKFVDELPKTNSGKVLRRALLETLGKKK